MDKESIEKIISEIVDQSIEQAALILNYDSIFNSSVISEIKNEKDLITKLSKLIHIFIEQLTSYQNKVNDIYLQKLQSSIFKIYPKAPKEIRHLLKWIPRKMAKEKQKIDNCQKNQIVNIQKTDIPTNNQTKEEILKQEIDQLKIKCSHITNSLNSIKENFEKNNEPNNYLDDIRQLKQANLELHENLANTKMQNKLLKSKITFLKKQQNIGKVSIQTQTLSQSTSNNAKNEVVNELEIPCNDKYDVLFSELKALRIEKERSDKKYISNVEYSSNLEEKLKKVQIERDSLQSKLNDLINLMNKKDEDFNKKKEKCEKLSQNCLRLETQIAKLKDKLNCQTEPFIPILPNNNLNFGDLDKSPDLKSVDIMINPFEIEFK
ncbi:hypothetical protein M9Y10_000059 [Tritrichomonas musculus]|uniref:Uncharacterized protein n=1 Tax=Tritrichomonas musculus TaxID=1915356 RepID=A0ABR2L480_9EUKA